MTANYSFYSIPAAWLLAVSPHMYAKIQYSLSSHHTFDNQLPRSFPAKLAADQSVPQATKDRILRAEGASANGFENLGLFAAAVAAGNTAGLDTNTLNWSVALYLGSRVMYNVVYVYGKTGPRLGVYLVGVGVMFALFGLAGSIVNARL